MIKFVWCLGHQSSGRFRRSKSQLSHRDTEWECIDCGAIMKKTGLESNQEGNWRLIKEVVDDSD